MQNRLPPFLENGRADVVERRRAGGIAAFFPPSFLCLAQESSQSKSLG
jgi:hypothetical protein